MLQQHKYLEYSAKFSTGKKVSSTFCLSFSSRSIVTSGMRRKNPVVQPRHAGQEQAEARPACKEVFTE